MCARDRRGSVLVVPRKREVPPVWGERIAFENPDNLTLLGALAAWTSRVRLLTTVIVPQLVGVVSGFR
jgi:alkanesulfonate monooxygenase SsuD/methylene tetrahydromethanopterin reductase-like flavin-dependent oxidoreductase (luciferase family)